MRKTEMTLGLIAGISGLLLAALSLMGITEYLPGTMAKAAYSGYVLLGANVLGIVGALIVLKKHFAGSAAMLLATGVVLLFGFPWQSISGVVYIMAIVLAIVPVKADITKAEKEKAK
jgi:hypothetical protein